MHRVVDPFFRSAYLYGGTSLTPAQEGRRYRIMILRQTDAAVVPKLKAGNPKLRVLMIVDMMSADPGDPTGISNWVGYTEADTNHPEWFLTDAAGNRLPFKDYPASLVMDIGNPAYQQAGLADITSLVKAGGFDGVFLDDANASLRWILAGGSAACVRYPTDAKWQSAVYSFLSSVAPQLRAEGLLVAANIGGSTITPGLWQKWNGPLDGAMEESFTNGGSGRDSVANGQWLAKLKHALWSEANGKIALDHAVTATRSGARYGLATMLLAANGENKFYASTDYSHEVWWPEYAATGRLGSPLGHFSVLPSGVYRRSFTNGVVLVNPQVHAASRVPLGGPYVGSGLGRVRSVRLAKTSGVVLLKS
jgi:putative glycosyl hydrolase-like family 15 (GHL15) protein